MKSPRLSGSETKMDDTLMGVLAPHGCSRRLSWGEGGPNSENVWDLMSVWVLSKDECFQTGKQLFVFTVG